MIYSAPFLPLCAAWVAVEHDIAARRLELPFDPHAGVARPPHDMRPAVNAHHQGMFPPLAETGRPEHPALQCVTVLRREAHGLRPRDFAFREQLVVEVAEASDRK